MEYNWGDPKKNSLLSSKMMAKAEITRKKRLTSVKSTLSNQLHPSNKLRTKKKTPDSARRHLTCDEANSQNSGNNNDSHDLDSQSTGKINACPQLASDDVSSNLDTIRHDSFPVPCLASYPNNISMFDEFGLNAAADGLFHPASTIEAFTEHDAKYHQEIQGTSEKPRSGPRKARSGSEYPPSRENHRLPSIPSGKTISNRSAPKLQPPGKNGSAPASLMATSSLSKLLDGDEAKRSLSATQSDSNLYAPRRLDVVPSSADRTALDFLEHELEMDNNSLYKSPVASTPQLICELDNNDITNDCNSSVPPLDLSLANKFEELKRIMKSNRDKRDSARTLDEQPSNQTPSTSTANTVKSSNRDEQSKQNGIRAASSGGSGVKNGGEASLKEKSLTKKHTTPAARVSTKMNNGSSNSKRIVGNQVSGAASRKMSSAIVRAPSIRSKKEMKARSGVSLSDLKAEHREALQMLKELGGPVDPDYQLADLSAPASSSYRLGITAIKTASISLPGDQTIRKQSNQAQARTSTTTPPTSASTSVSMVTKLRESISSGRSSNRESSPRNSVTDGSVYSPARLSGRMDHTSEVSGTQLAPLSSENAPSSSNQSQVKATTNDFATALEKIPATGGESSAGADPTALTSSSSPPALSPNTDSWRQYDDDDLDDQEEDNNEAEHDDSSEVKRSTDRSGDRYSDEDFESDW